MRRLAVIALLVLAVWGCADLVTGPAPSGDLAPRSLGMAPSALALTVGGSGRATATLFDAVGQPVAPASGRSIEYVSSAPGVFTVAGDGTATGVAAGQGTLTARYGAFSVGIPVTVTGDAPRPPVIDLVPAGPLVDTTVAASATNATIVRAVAIANAGEGTLGGLAASVSYADGQPAGWLQDLRLDAATAPTTLRFALVRGALAVGSYDAVVRVSTPTAGVEPRDLQVRLVVDYNAARIGLSRDTASATTYTGAAPVRIAVDVSEPSGLGEPALGALSCADLRLASGSGWATVERCADSVVVLLDPRAVEGEVTGTLRVAAANTRDTASLALRLDARRAAIGVVPDSLVASMVAGGAALRLAADVVESTGRAGEGVFGTLQCTLSAPDGAPAATVAACGDSVAVTVTPGAATGTFRYVVDVQAPNASAPVAGRSLPVIVTVTAAPAGAVLTLSPAALAVRAWSGAPALRRAVAVGEGSGLGTAALGAIACDAPVLSGTEAWASVERCGPDSVIVVLDPRALGDGDVRTGGIRVTAANARDAVTLPLDLSVSTATIGVRPQALVARVGRWGVQRVRLAADLFDAAGIGAESAFGALTCTVRGNPEQPALAVDACGDSLVVSLPIDNTRGNGGATLEYSVDIQAPAAGFFVNGANAGVVVRIIEVRSIEVVAGDGQSAPAGTVLPVAPRVRLVGDDGLPFAGAPVTFTVASGGGALATAEPVTADENGIAVAPAWTLGATPGTNTLVAAYGGREATVTARGTGDGTGLIALAPPGPVVDTLRLGIAADDARAHAVAVTNAGGGALEGLTATVRYDGETSGWIRDLRLDATEAPTTLRWQTVRGELPPGSYGASIVVASTSPGVQPVELVVELVVAYNAAAIGFSPAEVEGRGVTNGPRVRVAADLVELTGLGEDALGPVQCLDFRYAEADPFASIESCGDSIVLLLDPRGFNGTATGALRVTGAFTRDTATLSFRLTAFPARLGLSPSPLVVRASTGGGSLFRFVDILDLSGVVGEQNFGPIETIVTAPDGAPSLSVVTAADTMVLMLERNGGAVGTFEYAVRVAAPFATVPIEPAALRVLVELLPAPVVSIVAGDGQSAPPGSTLPVAPRVRVADAQGLPIVGAPVAFRVTAGGGSLERVGDSIAVATDGDGIATAPSWTLGAAAGSNQLTATALEGPAVTFTATGVAAPLASTIDAAVGNDQSGPVASTLALAPVALVRDANAQPIAGAVVTWTVTRGNGTVAGLTTTTSVTDALGRATVAPWVLGTIAGDNRVVASVAGTSGTLTRNFNATGIAGPAVALAVVSGGGQSARVLTSLAANVVVAARDQYGNGVRDVRLTVTPADPAGLLELSNGQRVRSSENVTSGSAGSVSLPLWWLGATPGAQALVVTATGLPTLQVPATATPNPARAVVKIDNLEEYALTVGTSTSFGFARWRVVDADDAPVARAYVEIVLPRGGGGVNGTSVRVLDDSAFYALTGADGTVSVNWGAPQLAGAYPLVVRSGEAQLGATFVAGPAEPATFELVTGDAQSGTAGVVLPEALVLRARDRYGNLAVGQAVGWSVTSGGGFTSTDGRLINQTTGSVVDGAGLARIRWTPGYTATSQSVEASSFGTARFTFTASVAIVTPTPTIVLGPNNEAALGTVHEVRVVLPSNPNGTTMTISSSAPGVLGDTLDPTTVFVQPFQLDAVFRFVARSLGTATLRVTATGFTDATLDVPVVDRRLAPIAPVTVGLGTTTALRLSLSRPAPGGGTATVGSSFNLASGSRTVAPGDTAVVVPLRGLRLGSEWIPVTVPYFRPESVFVTVDAPPALAARDTTVGAGLQVAHTIALGQAVGPFERLDVVVTSTNPEVVRLSTRPDLPGAASVSIRVPDGASAVTVWVQGRTGVADTATVRLTASGYAPGQFVATVVEPGVAIVGLPPTMTLGAAEQPFQVVVGIPDAERSGLVAVQAVRGGSDDLPVRVTVEGASVGQLRTLSGQTTDRTILLRAGAVATAATVAGGGVAFVAQTTGIASFTGQIPGFRTTAAARPQVEVLPPATAARP